MLSSRRVTPTPLVGEGTRDLWVLAWLRGFWEVLMTGVRCATGDYDVIPLNEAAGGRDGPQVMYGRGGLFSPDHRNPVDVRWNPAVEKQAPFPVAKTKDLLIDQRILRRKPLHKRTLLPLP